MSSKLQYAILLSTALLLSNYHHLLSKRIARDRRNPVEFRSLQINPKNTQDNSEIPEEEKKETEKTKKQEEWRKREVTSADIIDLAAQTAFGTGIGYAAGSAVYTANTAITASTTTTAATAITTAAESAGAAKALLAVAKAITAAGTTSISAPVIVGSGMVAGGALGFYWAWSNWKKG